jgi:hypothetical protein
VERDVNLAAHTIAKDVLLCVIDRVWIEEISICICGIIYKELYAPRRLNFIQKYLLYIYIYIYIYIYTLSNFRRCKKF